MSEPTKESHAAPAEPVVASAPVASPVALAPSKTTLFLMALSAVALLISISLWLQLGSIQEALARHSADAGAAAVEARALAKAAQDTVRELSTRHSLLESRLAEVALQRGQLEDLIQSLSRSRDDNLLVDVDAALRMAQQQANLTGSLEPLLAALKSAQERVQRAAQPRLAPLQRALAKDIERVRSANVADIPSLLIKLDELVRLVDEMPLANAVAVTSSRTTTQASQAVRSLGAANNTQNEMTAGEQAPSCSGILAQAPLWLQQIATAMRRELRTLVQVGRIDTPEAALLSPEQSFFVRENIKLSLLNARLALLARHLDTTRNDLSQVSLSMRRYFDANSRAVQQGSSLLSQLQGQLMRVTQPRIDDTLSALATLTAIPGK